MRPTTEDHWVAAYGTYICGQEFNLGNLDNVVKDAPVDLHSDGLIHIHPTDEETSGKGCRVRPVPRIRGDHPG
ncbi:MAG: hypothetical protein M5U19_22690 [Microthrixaceae bacterium]|nr:hypothetical protein [Microthrixaceae bacterium]